jgi:hypothetical protein
MTTRKESKMTKRKVFEYGGILAGVVLIAFGIGALLMSFDARGTTRDEIKREQIVGSEDMSPSAIQAGIDEAGLTGVSAPSCDVAGEPIDTGSEARCFAQYLRIHALESSGGLTYAEMGRFVAADDPESPAGTSDAEAALVDEEGNPVPNTSRNTCGRAAGALRHRRRSRARAHGHRLPDPRRGRRAAPCEGDGPGSREGGARIVAAPPVRSAEPPYPPAATRITK